MGIPATYQTTNDDDRLEIAVSEKRSRKREKKKIKLAEEDAS